MHLQAILEFFEKFNDSISKDLQFVIDDISTEDTTAVGVTWHLGIDKRIFFHFLNFSSICYKIIACRKVIDNKDDITEWRGKLFPFSRGCSFYRLKIVDGQRQIM